MRPPSWRGPWLRWLRFNAVGAIGMGVQLAALLFLESLLRLDGLLATALAVETAVIHNFVWHERFTWPDRPAGNSAARFLKFNITTGSVSILGNVALTAFFHRMGHLPYWSANLASIAICSLANFMVSDRVVFERKS